MTKIVHPGEAILQIVPEKAGLVVRAQLEPIHVDQVWPGQDAVLRFSAFPARTTPEFHGRVIVHERRRKAVHAAIAEVRHAWWGGAVAAELALAVLEPLLARVRAALADGGRLAARQLQAPVQALRYQRALLEAVDALERQRRESRLAKIELARLIGLSPGTDYTLAVPVGAPEPRALAVTADELAALALAHRPSFAWGNSMNA